MLTLKSKQFYTIILFLFLLSAFVNSNAQISQIIIHGTKQIALPVKDSLIHFPNGIAFDAANDKGEIVKKVFVSWSIGADDASLEHLFNRKTSMDGGVTFGKKEGNPNVDYVAAIKQRNGKVIALPFKGNNVQENPSVYKFIYHTSNDNGDSWMKHMDGKVDFGDSVITTFRFHKGIIEENDGSLYTLSYGNFKSDKVNRVMLLKSTNGGSIWRLHSTVAYEPSKKLVLNEATIAVCNDNSWLVVMRNESYKPMLFVRSTDKGINWSKPKFLPGLPTGSTAGADDLNESVDPHLLLMPNGILALSYGRPNLHLAFSADGNGTNWSNITTTFVETPNAFQTSSYSVILPVGSNRLMQIQDSGADWSYPRDFMRSHSNPHSILSRFVDVLRTEKNPIDLKTLYKKGLIKVKSDMNFSNIAFPETQVSGAFGGSIEYWSGAFKKDNNAYFNIELDQKYLINDIGLCLSPGQIESAEIKFSEDGIMWSKPIIYNAGIYNSISYRKMEKAVPAKFVNIKVFNKKSLTSLNEIELYGKPILNKN